MFHGVEVCSGTGILSRVLRDGGYKVCNVDIIDWHDYFKLHRPKTSGNPLDLLSPGGMAFLDMHKLSELQLLTNEVMAVPFGLFDMVYFCWIFKQTFPKIR